jgi:hypothetical protein
LVHDPRERLQLYVDHRNLRERQILGVLEGGGAISSWDIMLELYPDIDKRLRRAAENNVRSHLRQLEEEGRLKVYAGKPRKPSAAKTVKQEEHAKHRQAVIKEADKFRDAERRAMRRVQENPPTSEWIEPPRYELN